MHESDGDARVLGYKGASTSPNLKFAAWESLQNEYEPDRMIAMRAQVALNTQECFAEDCFNLQPRGPTVDSDSIYVRRPGEA